MLRDVKRVSAGLLCSARLPSTASVSPACPPASITFAISAFPISSATATISLPRTAVSIAFPISPACRPAAALASERVRASLCIPRRSSRSAHLGRENHDMLAGCVH